VADSIATRFRGEVQLAQAAAAAEAERFARLGRSTDSAG